LDKTLPTYLRASGWNALLPARAPRTSVPAERRFEFVVIGAGYTGLAAARRIALAHPEKQVLLLEGDTVGEGAAGRNSGFVIDLPHNTVLTTDPAARQAFQRQIRLYGAGLSWLEDIVRTQRIDCDWSPAGKFYAAVTADTERKLRQSLAQYRDWGVPYTEFDRDGLAHEIGTSYYRYGFHTFSSVLVQPAALVRGLADSLPSNVVLLERTPALSLSERSPWRIATPAGEFVADKLVVANNGFARSLGLLRDRLMTLYAYAAMTPRLSSEQLRGFGRRAEWGVVPGKRIGSTVRRTADGRFLVRCGLSYERELPADRVLPVLTETYRRRFPAMAPHGFEHCWSGAIGLTRNGANYFGELRPGLFVSVGCNGVGILKGSTFGRLLGDLVLGIRSAELDDALALERPTWLPPDPLRRIGVLSAVRYQIAVAGIER
jgi:glycine/D-amino acid oxidase-like deaminating enzyme